MAYFRALKQALMWISRRQQLHFHLRLLRLFKVQRLGNILALLSSFFVSRMLGRPLAWGRPWALSVEPSGQCNLQCPECSSGALGPLQIALPGGLYRKGPWPGDDPGPFR